MNIEQFKELKVGQEVAIWNFFAEKFFVGKIQKIETNSAGQPEIVLHDQFKTRTAITNAHNVFLNTPMTEEELKTVESTRKSMRKTVREALREFDRSLTPYLIRMFRQNMNDWENVAEIKIRKRKPKIKI